MIKFAEGNVLILFYLLVSKEKTSVFYKDRDLEFHLENKGLLNELKIKQNGMKLHLIYEGTELKVHKQEYTKDNLQNEKYYRADTGNDSNWKIYNIQSLKPLIDAFVESLFNLYDDIKAIKGKEDLESFIYKIHIYEDLDFQEWVNEGDVEEYLEEVEKLKGYISKYIKQ